MQDYSINQFLALAGTPPLDIEICDVTLRDGEQMPGVVFRADEKLDLAQAVRRKRRSSQRRNGTWRPAMTRG